jgi:hypothetical protein
MHKQENIMHKQEAQYICDSEALYPPGGSSSDLTSQHLGGRQD